LINRDYRKKKHCKRRWGLKRLEVTHREAKARLKRVDAADINRININLFIKYESNNFKFKLFINNQDVNFITNSIRDICDVDCRISIILYLILLKTEMK